MKSPHYLKYEKSDKIVLKFAFFKDLFYKKTHRKAFLIFLSVRSFKIVQGE